MVWLVRADQVALGAVLDALACAQQAEHQLYRAARLLGHEFAQEDGLQPNHRQLRASHTSDSALSSREREVVELVARGLTNREVANNLEITQRTAGAHVEHILRKLGFTSRTQIAVWAAEQGLLCPSQLE